MPISASLQEGLNAAETDEVLVALLTISHASLTEPIRVCSDAVDTLSRGDTFLAFPFELTLPETDAALPRAQLVIDNVDRQIVKAVREMTSAAQVTIEIVRAADPDTVELSLPDFTLTDVRYDAQTVTGTLGQETFLAEPYPSGKFTPNDYPVLF